MRFLKGSAIAFASCIIVISTCAFSQDRDAITQQLHLLIIEMAEGYKNNTNSKALVGCINWQESTLNDISIYNLYWSLTSEGSGGQIFVTQLMQSTMHGCNRAREKAEADCQCVPIDKNGRSVLKVPDPLFDRPRAAPGTAQEREDLPKSEIDAIYTEGMRAYDNKDYESAFDQWKRLANQGHAPAAYDIADMYDFAAGVPHSPTHAPHYYLQAAERGHAETHRRP